MPVLTIAGELDHKFAAIGRQIAASVPEGESVEIPGAGHAAHLQEPEAGHRRVGRVAARRSSTDRPQAPARAPATARRPVGFERCRPAPGSAALPCAPLRTIRIGGTATTNPASAIAAHARHTTAITMINTAAAAMQPTYSQRVRPSPSRTANVRLPDVLIGRDVAQVVDHQQRARQESGDAPGHPGVRREAPRSRRRSCRRSPRDRRRRTRTPRRDRGSRTASGRRCSPNRRASPRGRRRSATTSWPAPAPARRPRRRRTRRTRHASRGRARPSPPATSRTGPTRTSSVPRTPSL